MKGNKGGGHMKGGRLAGRVQGMTSKEGSSDQHGFAHGGSVDVYAPGSPARDRGDMVKRATGGPVRTHRGRSPYSGASKVESD